MNTFLNKLTFFGLLVSAFVWSTTGHSAQPICASHDAAKEQLQKKFHEQVVGRGLTTRGNAMFELFVSEKGSWTLVVSQPNGRSCIFASGENWQQLTLLVGDPV